MTIKFFNTVILAFMAALLAWLVVLASRFESGHIALGIGSFLTFALTLVGGYGVKWTTSRGNVMCKVLSNLFLVIFLIYNFVFAFLPIYSVPVYIIIGGILLCIYVIWAKWVNANSD